MIGLPNGVRACRLAPVNQIESFAVDLGAPVRQGHEIGWQAADDAIDDLIRGSLHRCTAEIAIGRSGWFCSKCGWSRRNRSSASFRTDSGSPDSSSIMATDYAK